MYVDPGSGLMAVQALAATAVGLLFRFRKAVLRRIRSLWPQSS